MTTPTMGPCTPWDPICTISLTDVSPTVSGYAIQAASEILYQLSGQRFSVCEFTIRPCRQDCWGNQGWPFGGSWWEWGGAGWGGGSGVWPVPWLYQGNWYNLTCGGCSGSCSCTPLSEALLPSPVASIVSVKVDGATLTAGTDYRVDDYRKLVRLGGEFWPICQDLNLADTEVNTWSVTLTVGEEVPIAGRYAVGELFTEFVRFCTGAECKIPRTAASVSRQGITYDLPTIQEFLQQGFLGLPLSDMFIRTYNPHGLKAAPYVYDVDGEAFRRTGTA